jgi:hypothetical protein
MSIQTDKSNDYIQQKYLELIEMSNVNLHKKSRIFSKKNLLVYTGIFFILVVLGINFYNLSDESFKNHLITTKFNDKQIIIKPDKDSFYGVSDYTNQKWVTREGMFISVNAHKIVFQNTKNSFKENKQTYELWTPNNQQYTLVLVDGTEIKINEKSYIRFNNDRKSLKTQVSVLGETFFKVAHDSLHPFKINASSMDVEVYGTKFNLINYKDQLTSIALIDGSVKVSNTLNESKFIKPGQKATIYSNSKQLVIEKAQLDETLVWNTNRFHFNDEKLETILKKLSIWYKKDFNVTNKAIYNIRFTGNLKKEEGILNFLRILKYTENISYTIDDNSITLNK